MPNEPRRPGDLMPPRDDLLALPPVVQDALQQLTATGMFGDTVQGTAMLLLREKLRELQRDGYWVLR